LFVAGDAGEVNVKPNLPLDDKTESDSPMVAGKVEITTDALAHKEKDFISLLSTTPRKCFTF